MKRPVKIKKNALKIFSFAAGFFIWLYVVSSAEIELSKTIDIHVELPNGYSIKNEIPSEVIYRVKGPGFFVRKFFDDKNYIKIERGHYFKEEKQKFIISLEKLKNKLPLGLEIVDVSPRNFLLEIEKSFEKTVDVKPIISAEILNKYKLKDVFVTPSTVSIKGPKSLLKNIHMVQTKEIDKLEEGSNKEIQMALASPDRRVTLERDHVVVSVELMNKMKKITLSHIPIIFQSMEFIKNASQKEVELILEGNEELMNGLDQDLIQIVAIVPKGMKGSQSIKLITELPQGIKVIKLNPEIIQVNVE